MQVPINRLISQRITPWLTRLPLTPNRVTFLSFLAGALAIWNFWTGKPSSWIWGAVWFQVAYVLDNCDGELARLTNATSGFGSWLDLVTDCFIHMGFFWSLGMGIFRSDPNPGWTRLGTWAALSVFLTYSTFVMEQVRQRGRSALLHPDPPINEAMAGFWGKVRTVLRGDFSLVVLGSALVGQMGWLLWGGILGATIYWMLNVFSLLRAGFLKGLMWWTTA